MLKHKIIASLAAVLSTLVSLAARAENGAVGDWDARYQATYVWQQKEGFAAGYNGPHSLLTKQEDSYSLTATAFLGYRPWTGGELYLDPEVAQGTPLSGLYGLGGFTNGEIARAAGPTPTLYRARLFLRQTWGFGGGSDAVEADANQLAGSYDKQRLVLTVGNFSVMDVFDSNSCSHDPRVQFLNWGIMTHGAYDYAADSRGYSRGLALEYYHDDWAVRAGRFLQPKEPNQLALGADIFLHYGDQLELERGFHAGGQPGRVRLLAYRNKMLMSRYDDALAYAAQTGTTPDINAVRTGNHIKKGIGINLEQALGSDLSVFARAMHADGQTETYAFTEMDDSVALGTVITGARWQRADDRLGLAASRNGISRSHREYLAQGGMGFFIGDGQLNYHPEQVVEAFYNIHCKKNLWLTPDWQYIRHPGYNADRGSLHVLALRAHTEF